MMSFDLAATIAILARTPRVLSTLLEDLSDGWTMQNEGGTSWSSYDILGHFIHGEKTDWILENHHPEPLTGEQKAELSRILRTADNALAE